MSKKKNTLQDLDDFLKQQAATLVTPDTLSQTVASETKDPVVRETSNQASEKIKEEVNTTLSTQDPTFRKKLYDYIIASLESQEESLPEDKMLINTALYLKAGGDWKNAVREYWRGR